MQATNQQLLNSFHLVAFLSQADEWQRAQAAGIMPPRISPRLTATTNWKLGEILDDVRKACDRASKAEGELAKECGATFVNDQRWVVEPAPEDATEEEKAENAERRERFTRESAELSAQQVEIFGVRSPIPLVEFENAGLFGAEFSLLRWLIAGPPEESAPAST